MSKAHQSSNLELMARPVIIDSPGTAHFSFNNGMAGNGYPLFPLVDPVTRQLSGASTAVEGSDQKYIDQLTTGLFNNGLVRNEFTTNLIPQANQNDLTGWSSSGHTDSGSTVTAPNGLKMKLWNVADEGYVYFDSAASFTVEASYAASMYVYSNQTYTFSIRWNDNQGGVGTTLVPVQANIWTKISTTKAYNSSITAPTRILIGYRDGDGATSPSGLQVAYCMAQLEQKAYATAFTSSTRDEVYVAYPGFPTKTWSSWICSTSSKVCTQPAKRTIVKQYDSLSDVGWWVYVAPLGDPSYTAGTAVLEIVTSGKANLRCNVPTNLLDSAWHHISVEINSTSQIARLWVDDQYSDTTSLSGYNLSYAAIPICMGYADTSDAAGNFVYDEMRLDPRNYPSDDIRRRFISKAEYQNPYGMDCI